MEFVKMLINNDPKEIKDKNEMDKNVIKIK